jgi:hypothetical protein
MNDHFLGYLMDLAILIVVVDKQGPTNQWAQAIEIFVMAGFLFFTFKFIVFGEANLLIKSGGK